MGLQGSITKVLLDQLNRTVEVPINPQRIISLVPSQTELLFDLGLDETVVGITKFCVHPENWFKSKARIGGTKNINFETIKLLNPDLIISNKEENDENQISRLMVHYPVWVSDIKTLDDAVDMIERVGVLVNKKDKAIEIKNKIENNFKILRSAISVKPKTMNINALYLIWKNPFMAAGCDTFISNMMQHCGLKNAIAPMKRYPEIDKNAIEKTNPDYILLSSEPFPFNQKHVDELLAISPESKVILVDGEYFSWYGSRLILAPDYFMNLLTDNCII